MKKLILSAMALSMACNSSHKTVDSNSASNETSVATKYAAEIKESDLKDHLYTYASDEFEGRETGQPGQKKAVAFIKKNYEELGIPPAQSNGDYFQKVPLIVHSLPDGDLSVKGKTFSMGEDFITFNSAMGEYPEVVYVGYGIDEGSYNDYKDLDVTGKVVLAKKGEPKNTDGTYILTGNSEPSKWSNTSEAIGKRNAAAKAHGAAGILYFDDTNFARYSNYYKFSKANKKGRMGLKEKEDTFFNLLINEDLAKALLPNIEGDDSPKLVSVPVSFQIKGNDEELSSENVAAMIKGTEFPNQYVIVSGHLDHIGINADGQINNGADDDGSGTVSVLAIAKAFKKAADDGHGPKRSIIFLNVTGEEKGLLGSQYYTDYDPIVPLSQTVADLNIDMVGRIDPQHAGNDNYVYLIGSDKLSTELHELSEAVNKKYVGLDLDYTYNDENDPNRFYYRSDHYNFAKNNIPIIFYFNGTHADYHKPTDTPDKIDYPLLQKRAQLVFYTAWEVANRPTRLVVDKADK